MSRLACVGSDSLFQSVVSSGVGHHVGHTHVAPVVDGCRVCRVNVHTRTYTRSEAPRTQRWISPYTLPCAERYLRGRKIGF